MVAAMTAAMEDYMDLNCSACRSSSSVSESVFCCVSRLFMLVLKFVARSTLVPSEVDPPAWFSAQFPASFLA